MIKVYGSSDDLIEVEGDVVEEFNPHDSDKADFLAFSDGTVLSIEYTSDGIWRINRVATGTAGYSKVEATDDEKNYTDTVTLDGKLTWVVFGSRLEKK